MRLTSSEKFDNLCECRRMAELEYSRMTEKDKSELSIFQRSVGEWGDETFNSKREYDKDSCTRGMFNLLMLEVKELERACRCATDPNTPTGERGGISEEVADCFLLLLYFAHLHGFDLLEEARKKMEINRKRTWGEPDENGVIEHIKD